MMMTLRAYYPKEVVSEFHSEIMEAYESAKRHHAKGAVSIKIEMHMVELTAHYRDHVETDTFASFYEATVAAENHCARGAHRFEYHRTEV